MRIGLITHTFRPEMEGGRERYVENLATCLGKRHDVIVFAGSENKKIQKLETEFFTLYKIPSFSIRLSDELYYRIMPSFLNLLKNEELDIIHSQDFRHFPTDVSAFYSKISKVPLVLTYHGYPLVMSYLKFISNFYDNSLGFFTVSTSKKIICVSNQQYFEMLNKYKNIKEKLVIIPNGINLEEIIKARKKVRKEKIVLSVGRLIYRKGYHVLVEAAKYIDAKLYIIGPDYGQKKNLETQIKKNKLEGKVFLLDRVSEEEKNKFFLKSMVFVIPSLYEGLPTVLLEAMTYGLPVVCSDLPGLKTVVKNNVNGLIAKVGSSKDLAEKINMLLDNDNLRKEIVRKNKEDVKNYSWGEISKKIENVYEDVLNGN